MYTVIGSPKTRAMRVIWMLEELGEPYEIDPIRPRGEEARAYNPMAKVPSLKTPEGTICDSVAILTYLADKHGMLTYPAGTMARARQDFATQTIVAEVDAALWTAAKHSFALPEDWRVPEIKPTARKEFARGMAALEAIKGDDPFLAGDQFTIADLLLGQCSGWALAAKFELPGGDFGDYLKSLSKRPAMQRALKRAAELG